jgi:hypothetical protein
MSVERDFNRLVNLLLFKGPNSPKHHLLMALIKFLGKFNDGDKWNGKVYDNDRINKSKHVNGVKQ